MGSDGRLRRGPLGRMCAAVTALALTLSVAAVHAEPTAADRETARALMTEGRALRAKGDHKGALERFKTAHDLMNFPTTGLELGKTQVELGMLLEARDTCIKAARLPVEKGEPKPFAGARTECDTLAEQLASRTPSLRVTLSGTPDGMTPKITVDKDDVAPGALLVPRKVNPGKHVVSVKAGATLKKQTVEVAESETREVKFDLSDAEPEDASATPKKKDSPTTATTTTPETPTPAPKEGGGTSSLVWIGLITAGVGVVAGGATGLISMSKTKSAKDQCVDNKCPPSAHADVDSAMLTGNISTIAFGVAGVGAVLGVIGLLVSPSASTEPAPKVSRLPFSVWVGVGSAGVVGAF
jgi:hypothetical protein